MRYFKLFFIVLSLGSFAFISSCTGPEGPAGPKGATGADGSDGTPGVAGNLVCMECHNTTTKANITNEYLTSGHAAGTTVGYAGGRSGCAKCHSDQGFTETQYTGEDTTAEDISLPQNIQCHTCHDFHQSLDFENEPNYALRTIKPVNLLMYRADDPAAAPVTINLGSESNLCANCHQPRKVEPVADSTGNYAVTSKYYGPHYGTQSTTLAGLGAYEIGTGYPAAGTGSKHATDATCVTCHMHGSEHTWEPSLDACNTSACHNGSITTLTDNTRQLAFATLMSTLETKLITAGLLLDGYANLGTYPVDEVGAFYNYKWLLSDRSNGVHNFQYTETLLNNSVAVFP
jgi:hypothetical protein